MANKNRKFSIAAADTKKNQTETEALNADASKPFLEGTVLHAFSGLYEVDVREGLRLDETLSAAFNAVHKPQTSDEARGLLAQKDGSDFDDDIDDDEYSFERDTLLCTVSGKLKIGKRVLSQVVAAGDRVRVRWLDTFGPNTRRQRMREGYIEEVLPRVTTLGRSRFNKSGQVTVANLDQVVVVMSLREPALNTHRLDRFLVLAESCDLRAVICLNKADMLAKRVLNQETKPLKKLYESLGYRVLIVSAETDLGIKEVRQEMSGHISAFVGSSGVGKSSLVNAIQPGLHLWVGDVMEIGKGRHTTTDVSLHRLDGGGYLADTPGIKTVSLFERQEVDLAQCFPEFRAFENGCRFNNCTHLHEPGCAVREAVEAKTVNAARYESYKRIAEDKEPALY